MTDIATRTITHHPTGIDDPYKRLPTERFPRDPQPGDRVQVNFRAGGAQGAVVLQAKGGAVRVEATPLGQDLWTADLGPVETGEYSYVIGTEEGVQSGPYPFTVGRWRQVSGVSRVEVRDQGVILELQGVEGWAGSAALSFPRAGVCRLHFGTGEAPPPAGLPCHAEQDGDLVTMQAEGTEVQVNLATLDVHVTRPGRTVGARSTLAFRWLEGASGLNQIEGRFRADPGEPLYGLGERFDTADRRGRVSDVRVYEEYKEQGARTYLPVPFVVSPGAWGLWLDAAEPSSFDLRGETCVITLDKLPESPLEMALHLIVADEPYGVTAAFTALNGGLAVPPKWAFGPWMSSNDWNNQARTEEVIRRTLAEDVPATVLVLEAWSDESTFYIWNDAQYTPKPGAEALTLSDFTFTGRWPDPKGLIDECHANGLHVLLWQIPVQKHVPEDHAQHRADEAHMVGRGYGVKEADGRPYRCQGWWFTDGLVMDFTNPEASAWWFAKRAYLFDELGIDGMKTDGGEHLWGRDLRLHDGRRGLEMYNGYPNSYVGAYHAFVQERTGGNGLTFSRAGFTGAGQYPAHWAGDENSTWNALRASIQAGLSAGVSGVSLWSWDIGGFSGEIPTVELYLRSVAFGAFCPVMQYHSEWNPAVENRDRTPWNLAERHRDPRTLEVYRRYAKLRMRLLDYLYGEAQAMSAEGLPLMRYPGLVSPQAGAFLAADPHAYLFTRDLLVCPVVEKGAQAREVRLPPGRWVDAWSGRTFEGNRVVLVPAPLECLPLFIRADSPRLEELRVIFATF
ncbi:TIM-barrel domain-containing protein [Deinococcus apachensis]|uniref:glycoside hydrolase family 31 protein n=1 Tax=Deinococcus apachensis TaxID=309886 RepID=UPI00036F34D6|nr:TIM-barrel domain-containing protein [Deinococcus apachensis]